MTIKPVTRDAAYCNFCDRGSFEVTIHTFLIASKEIMDGYSPNNTYHICNDCLEAFKSAMFSKILKRLKSFEHAIQYVERQTRNEGIKREALFYDIKEYIEKFYKELKEGK